MSHHLVGVAEVAGMLGVSRQRVGQLMQTYPDFPAPEIELAAGRVWSRDKVQAWIDAHPDRPTGRPSYEKLSPFEAVHWSRDRSCDVQVGGTWYALLAVEGVALSDVVEFAVGAWGDRWQKRIDEDLVEVLDRLGHPVESTVRLRLRTGDGEVVEVTADATRANRDAVYRARNAESMRAIEMAGAMVGMARDVQHALAAARTLTAELEALARRLS